MVSSTTSVKRWYWRVTLGTLGAILTTLKSIWSEPKNALPVFISEPDMQLYPDVWSAYGGVGSSGSQAARRGPSGRRLHSTLTRWDR